jgi:hypothetical protein
MQLINNYTLKTSKEHCLNITNKKQYVFVTYVTV